SSVPFVSGTASTAPGFTPPGPPLGGAPAVSVVATASEIATQTATMKTTTKTPPSKVATKTVRLKANPTLTYDLNAIERVVMPLRSSVQMCVNQSAPKRDVFTIHLELWSIGDDMGKVRSVEIGENRALDKCLIDIFSDVSFGPPNRPDLPPGAVFVTVTLE